MHNYVLHHVMIQMEEKEKDALVRLINVVFKCMHGSCNS